MPYVIDIWVAVALYSDLRADSVLPRMGVSQRLAYGMRMAKYHIENGKLPLVKST